MRNDGTMPSSVVQTTSERKFLHTSVLLGTRKASFLRIGDMTNLATTLGSGRSWGTLVMAVMLAFFG